ncbi:MAG: HEPN domain-containing protein [Candidatus Hodarchaeota archaeon]
MKRTKDWLKQAEHDVQAAKDSMLNEHNEWACFQSQQAAEKAFKAIFLSVNIDAWGHSLVHLLKRWQEECKKTDFPLTHLETFSFDLLLEKCQELDRHYIQPRYPNGFASGFPAEYYNRKIASQCIQYAEDLIAFAKETIKQVPPLEGT